MAYFAKLDDLNKVTQVLSVSNDVITEDGIEKEELGQIFLRELFNEPNAVWKQTSYNTNMGVHNFGKTSFRKNHAGIGYTYDENRDAFISPKPFNSWILNDITCVWEPPIQMPEDDGVYDWNEDTLSWERIEIE